MKRGEIVTVAVQGDYGKPCPAVVIQPGLAGRDGERAIADTLLIPFQPRTFDVWAIDHMRALIEDAATINEKLKAYSVLNAADAIGKDNEDAAAVLRQCTNIHYLDCPLVRRKAFPNAAAQGKGVGEYTPRDPKAIDELTTLMAFIYQNDG